MNRIYKSGQSILSETSVGDLIYRWYNYASSVITQRSFNTEGFYTVKMQIQDIEPFPLHLPGPKLPLFESTLYEGGVLPFRSGMYEPPIQRWLDTVIEPSSTFWEVGARFGYYSVGLAQVIDSVVAFEMNPDYSSHIQYSIERNNLDNVTTVTGVVGEDIHLDDFESPDVILMDVDGAEYDVLKTAIDTIRAHPIWIIEVNETENHDPIEIESAFQENGYKIQRSSYPPQTDTYHILTTPK